MRIKNLPSILSMDGSQDALVIEQTDGSEDKSRKVSPAQLKQYVLNDMDEVPTQNSNNPVKSGGIFSTMAVPKYDATNRREYFEGGGAFGGNIDSSPTAGSDNAVASGGTKTYVDSAVSQLNDEIAVQSVNNIDSLKTSKVSVCYGTLYKINGLVFLNFTAIYTSEMSASNTVLSLPNGFRPSSAVYGNGVILKSNGEAYTALARINANGNVFGDTGTTGTVLSGTIIYKV